MTGDLTPEPAPVGAVSSALWSTVFGPAVAQLFSLGGINK